MVKAKKIRWREIKAARGKPNTVGAREVVASIPQVKAFWTARFIEDPKLRNQVFGQVPAYRRTIHRSPLWPHNRIAHDNAK